MLIDGDYRYARIYGELTWNTTYWITKTNDLLLAPTISLARTKRWLDKQQNTLNGFIECLADRLGSRTTIRASTRRAAETEKSPANLII